MKGPEDLMRENQALRDRLARLSEASLRINESLDFDTVLQGVLDSARDLTKARYGVITLLDEAGQLQDFLSSGMSSGEDERLWEMTGGRRLFDYLSGAQEPFRVTDLVGHLRSLGLPELSLPMPVGPVVSFLAGPVFHRGGRVGNFFLAEKEGAPEFTLEDEETLMMFASQAAMVIANARRYRDERRARADLETLIQTSPVGVAVFDARTGVPVSFNQQGKVAQRNTGQVGQLVLGYVALVLQLPHRVGVEQYPGRKGAVSQFRCSFPRRFRRARARHWPGVDGVGTGSGAAQGQRRPPWVAWVCGRFLLPWIPGA